MSVIIPKSQIDRYAFAPGAFNALRVWIRRRARFSTYHFYLAPFIGWPQVIGDDD